ncbi:pickpocket protein 28-like [Tribolium madens]|uniref:pickpocket protein 28-like n=1 Tax=Tribolium madens TaxID=41895 RepID=UPI001CF74B33|nr:pickpocket protein 28-like [Tribolium madens]
MVLPTAPETKKSDKTAYFSEFSNNTTIHGFRYFSDRGITLFEKIWWFLTFCLCAYICASLIASNWKKWDENPVFLSVSPKPMKQWEIPFPAITICPENKIWGTKYNFTHYREKFETGNMTDEELQHFADVTMFCHATPETYMFEGHNMSIDSLNFLINEFHGIQTLIHFCIWVGRTVQMCNFQFSPILTIEGLCISFNTLNANDLFTNKTYIFEGHFKHDNVSNWDFDNNYAKANEIGFPVRSSKITDYLTVRFNLNLNNIDKKCDKYEGYKIYAHHPAELPSKYVKIGNEKKYKFGIKPEATITDSSLKNYAPHRRKCFYSYERPLKFFKIYTKQNCDTECLANFTLKRCGCVPFYMPFEKSTPICGYSNFVCKSRARNILLDMEMVSEVEKSSDLTDCDCLPSCTTIKYNLEVSVEEPGTEANFLSMVFTSLDFAFNDVEFVPLTRNELFGNVDFWANLGGLLGLFCGFSAMSFFEIIYYMTLRWMCPFCCFWKQRLGGLGKTVS